MNMILQLHYNYTGKLDHRQNSTTTLTGTMDGTIIVFLLICSFIIVENLIVLLAIWKNNRFHNRMYFFIANLALCDVLDGLAYLINLLMSGKKTLELSTSLWFVREGSLFVVLAASIFSLLAIAIERHLTMIKMRPYDSNQKYRVFFLIGACWVIAIILGSLPILGWNCLDNLPDCSVVLPLYSKKYVAFCVIVFVVLLLTMSVLYVRIYILVRSSTRKVNRHSNSEHAISLLRTVIIVVGAFIICWTPIFVLLLMDVACKDHCAILYKAEWFVVVAVFNSAMNPIIYTLSSSEMRRALLSLVCGTCYKPAKFTRSGSGSRYSHGGSTCTQDPSPSTSRVWSIRNILNPNQQISNQTKVAGGEETGPCCHKEGSDVA